MSGVDFAVILEKLDSPEVVARNLPEYLPKIIEILQDKFYESYNLKIMTTLLGPVAALVDPVELEKELLITLLPAVNRAFDSALREVWSSLENNCEFEEEDAINLSRSLQLCLSVIDGYYELVVVLNKIKNLEARNATTLIKVLPAVLRKVFQHCHGSEEMYGCYFSDSTTVLSAIFIKSYQLYLNYCKLLECGVSFKLSYEEEMCVLAEVVENLCSINDVVIKLDTKTIGLVWKHFAAIICKYSRELKERLSMEQPITCLCTCITDTITRLIDLIVVGNDDDKTREAALKLGNFLLKILIRICELYQSYLNDCFQPIFYVLVKLSSCSRKQNLKHKDREELTRFISVASTTLIKVVLNEDEFRNVVENKLEETFDLDNIGTFFLTILLMRKIGQEPKKFEKWFDYPLAERAITFYDTCGYSIDTNSITEGTNSYFFIVYTIGLFILAPTNCSSFSKAERVLLEKLAAQNIETAVLASDILAFVCRHAGEQYCCDMASALWQYLVSWTSSQWRPEYIIFGCTFKRLFRTLSPIRRKKFCSENPRLMHWSGIRELESLAKLDLESDATICITRMSQLSYTRDIETFQVEEFLNFVQSLVNAPFCAKWQENVLITTFRLAAGIVHNGRAQREFVFKNILKSVCDDGTLKSVRLKIAICRFIAAVVHESAYRSVPLNEAILSQVLLSLFGDRQNSLVYLRSILLMISIPNQLCSKDSVVVTLSSEHPTLHGIVSSYFDEVLYDDVPGATPPVKYFEHKCIELENKSDCLESEPASKRNKITSEDNDEKELLMVVSRLKDDLSKIKGLISKIPTTSSEVKDIVIECAKEFEFLRDFV